MKKRRRYPFHAPLLLRVVQTAIDFFSMNCGLCNPQCIRKLECIVGCKTRNLFQFQNKLRVAQPTMHFNFRMHCRLHNLQHGGAARWHRGFLVEFWERVLA